MYQYNTIKLQIKKNIRENPGGPCHHGTVLAAAEEIGKLHKLVQQLSKLADGSPRQLPVTSFFYPAPSLKVAFAQPDF